MLWSVADSDINDINLSDMQVKQARLHCKLGGLGLVSTSLIKSAAWLGSWTLTKNLLKQLFQDTPFHGMFDTFSTNPHQSITVQSIIDAHAHIKAEFRRANKINMPDLDQLEVIKQHAQRHYCDAILHLQESAG